MAASNLTDFPTRIKTAVILSACFIALTIWATYSRLGTVFYLALVFALICVACYEYSKFPLGQSATVIYARIALLLLPSCVIAISLFVEEASSSLPHIAILLFAVLMFQQVIGITWLAMKSRADSINDELLFTLGREQLGYFLLGAGGGAAFAIASASPLLALALVCVVAVADSSAYFAGRSFGDKKVAPLVSPKKTLAGTMTGIFAGGLIGTILILTSTHGCILGWPVALLGSIGAVICSQAGDYAKSIVKRRYNVKDFGRIFPGHGGVLDRLDGIFGAAPFVLAFLVISCSL